MCSDSVQLSRALVTHRRDPGQIPRSGHCHPEWQPREAASLPEAKGHKPLTVVVVGGLCGGPVHRPGPAPGGLQRAGVREGPGRHTHHRGGAAPALHCSAHQQHGHQLRAGPPPPQGLGFDPETCAIMAALGLQDQFMRLSEPIDDEEHRWNAWDAGTQRVQAATLVLNPEHKHRRCRRCGMQLAGAGLPH